MKYKDDLKREVCAVIDKERDTIIDIGRRILSNPELGYKEFRTSDIVKESFSKLSLEYTDGLAITGVKAKLHGRNNRYNIAVLGELDAVLCPMHPYADRQSGAAHSCGHNAQIASMLGTAIGLVNSGSAEYLDGNVIFMAVPAEEFVEIEYRQRLKQEGKIVFLGGKQELIRLGAFDEIDMAMMVHSQANTPEAKVFLHGGSTGFVGKAVQFTGREAHAGGAPHEGVNALNAAMASLMCIHAQRETFRDEDHIRVHPIITKGGDLVNIVPADVRMETYVRGGSIEAVLDANKKVNRAIQGGSYAIGAEVKITELPGYLPLKQDYRLGELFKNNVTRFVEEANIFEKIDMIGSTDMGDLGNLMPVIQPTMGGFKGSAHSQEFEIADEEAAYIIPAKVMAMTVIDLLCDGASGAADIKKNFVPRYNKDSYLNMWESLI